MIANLSEIVLKRATSKLTLQALILAFCFSTFVFSGEKSPASDSQQIGSSAGGSQVTCHAPDQNESERLSVASQVTINKFGACRILSSTPQAPIYFIPLRTGGSDAPIAEWDSFRNHLPRGVSAVSCTSPSWNVGGYGACTPTTTGSCGAGQGTQTRSVSCVSFDCSTGTPGPFTPQANSVCQSSGASIDPGQDLNGDGVPDSSMSCDVACAPPSCGASGSYANAAAVNAAGLCSSGNASPAAVSGTGPWIWSCQAYGQTPASCSATAAPTAGVCNLLTENPATPYSNSPDSADLCALGSTPGQVADNGNSFSWTCSNASGASTNCAAPALVPICYRHDYLTCVPTGPTTPCVIGTSSEGYVTATTRSACNAISPSSITYFYRWIGGTTGCKRVTSASDPSTIAECPAVPSDPCSSGTSCRWKNHNVEDLGQTCPETCDSVNQIQACSTQNAVRIVCCNYHKEEQDCELYP